MLVTPDLREGRSHTTGTIGGGFVVLPFVAGFPLRPRFLALESGRMTLVAQVTALHASPGALIGYAREQLAVLGVPPRYADRAARRLGADMLRVASHFPVGVMLEWRNCRLTRVDLTTPPRHPPP